VMPNFVVTGSGMYLHICALFNLLPLLDVKYDETCKLTLLKVCLKNLRPLQCTCDHNKAVQVTSGIHSILLFGMLTSQSPFSILTF
jgi:hypothetical protein